MAKALAGAAVRIGLIGLGRIGAHHLERIILRDDLRVVSACPAETEDSASTHPLCRDRAARVDEVLRRNDLDWLLIAAPQAARAKLAVAALEAGKHVAVESPPCATSNEARRLLAVARRTSRAVCVLSARRENVDFRAARTVVGQGLGTVQSARMISWGREVHAELECKDGKSPPSDSDSARNRRMADDPLDFFAYQYLDQLFQLVSRPAVSVYARIPQTAEQAAGRTAFAIAITFRDGGDALIDVNLHSEREFRSGWLLSGTQGAYYAGRLAVADRSGEMCDAPVCVADLPPFDVYSDIIAAARAGAASVDSLGDAQRVIRVIEAMRASAGAGQSVQIDPE